MAEPYRKDMDFAFFAVNFGYSKKEYEELTNRDKAFVYKAYEDKLVAETQYIYNAVYTAIYNANRKKGKKALKLWKKRSVQKANPEIVSDNLKVIREIEEKEGLTWIERIYQENGLPAPERRETSG